MRSVVVCSMIFLSLSRRGSTVAAKNLATASFPA